MPENYLKILTDPSTEMKSEFKSLRQFSVDLIKTLFVSEGLCPGPADGGYFVGENNPFGKERPAGFFKDHKKIFICLNTLSKSRIFFDTPGINVFILCMYCLCSGNLAAFDDTVDRIRQLGG